MFIQLILKNSIIVRRKSCHIILRNVTNLKSPYSRVIFKESDETVINLIRENARKIVYNSVLESKKLLKSDKKTNATILKKLKTIEREIKSNLERVPPAPLALNYCDNTESISSTETKIEKPKVENNVEIDEKKKIWNWMVDYENYEDKIDENPDLITEINYGTPQPNIKPSHIPCGGCGAFIHCQDPKIPGYIPSEIFLNSHEKGGASLHAILCQRCHFLKYYNLALKVNVKPEDYPQILANVADTAGVVVLLADLLDFPCSIWPGIADIFRKSSIVVVGNKIDLLPKLDNKQLTHIKQVLLDNVKLSGFGTLNIKNIVLISAKTGLGVEELITRIQSLYREKGHVYIIGCTNVGKSSLFNTLIRSDLCKIQAMDLIQRATISVWPGTTLNLLKFPIRRPAGYFKYLRHKRLQSEGGDQVNITVNPYKEAEDMEENFDMKGHANESGKTRMGINENLMEYKYSRWCYDTPGVIQDDQITHMLTTEELSLVLPDEMIIPRNFRLKPGMTLFIAGLSRLDFVEGPGPIVATVFCSNQLPLTICSTDVADEIYNNLLGTELFKVPFGDEERLRIWPKLEASNDLTVIGESWNKGSKDIVLSNSGWVSITGSEKSEFVFKGWTPEKRGIHLRDCMLPHAVNLKGAKISNSVAYKKHKSFSKILF